MKKRLDDFLVGKKIVENKSKAKQHIVNRKEVFVNDILVTKAGHLINSDTDIVKLKINKPLYVSRAGLKLDKAVSFFALDLSGKTCIDIGASTGGFTQVCLNNGANKVYAVDVGTAQLNTSIKLNSKVEDLSPFNFRYAKKADFNQRIDFFCCDVSFISLDKILPSLNQIIDFDIEGVVLLKPQFEIQHINKETISFSRQEHIEIILNFIDYAKKYNFSVVNLTLSPILGNKKKNVEFLVHLRKTQNVMINFDEKKVKKIF